MIRWLVAAALGLGVLAERPAEAASLPPVDFGDQTIVGLGVGADQALTAGGSLSIDVPVGSRLLLGGAVASTLGGQFNYDLRGVYRLVEGSRETPAIGGILGLWGAPGMAGFQLPVAAAPFVGFALAYAATDQIDLRLNLAYSPFFDYGPSEFLGFIGGPPVSGLEVGYQLTPNLEATIGINGRGDFAGVNYAF